ncbi:hypothetical protein BV504_06900 [Halomonas sp. 'Soap Lake |nr:hypothetical protein B2G49_06900 [Halomonas sp. 'Soap Lake \
MVMSPLRRESNSFMKYHSRQTIMKYDVSTHHFEAFKKFVSDQKHGTIEAIHQALARSTVAKAKDKR